MRLEILKYLASGPATLDEMSGGLDCSPAKLLPHIIAAKRDALIAASLDDVTKKPLYAITDKGLERIATGEITSKKSEPVPVPAHVTKTKAQLPQYAAPKPDADPAASPAALMAEISELKAALAKAQQDLETTQHKAVSAEAAAKIATELLQQTQDDPNLVFLSSAKGFCIRAPQRPARFASKLKNAQALAIAAARRQGLAEVYAMIPAGKAIRGAEWRAAK